ncbi:coniferyl alcohol acyltransferase-like [Prosopis cineraria]|uniref:coniferyl alcohol acyltransferase-like n=1 Tax=Prosopis cineraria TaxID=364024 RepID=UPI00240FDC9A|nr:coniferyl alcohol acyltransferase-like [Prosopis cineraria]
MLDILEDFEASEPGKLIVEITKKSVVKAMNHPPASFSITLSNLDLLSGRFPVTYLYFFRRPKLLVRDFGALIESLKSSLAQTLDCYYPFAGQIVQNPKTGEPEIICDNNGALIVEAHANLPMKELNFHNLNETIQGKLVSIQPGFPLQTQITDYTCGSISIAFTFDHALGDASSFGKFIASWFERAQNKPLSILPDHTRHLQARFPPKYHPSLDQTFIKCTIEEIQNMPTNNITLKRLYHINASSIDMLQRLASRGGTKRTKIEAFSSYVWKIMIRTIDQRYEKCKMGWLVDGREKIGGKGSRNCMSNYIGNVLSLAFGEARIQELKEASISETAKRVHEAITEVNNEAHFLDLIDWVECQRPGLMLAKAVLGQEGPVLVVSSGRRFPVTEVDFGFGSPVLGTVYTSVERVGVGYMNQRQSGSSDGSWTVSAILWPELAAALEDDPIFQPMTASHLQL